MLQKSWKQLGQDIDGKAPSDRNNWCVSLSTDGQIIAIGAPWNDDYDVHSSLAEPVYIYQYNGFSWAQIGKDIDGDTICGRSGNFVSLSPGGAIYAPTNTVSGCASIYRYIGAKMTIGQDSDGKTPRVLYGWSGSLSSDGKMCAICTPNNDVHLGNVCIYQRNGSSLTQLGQSIDGGIVGEQCSYSVSFSSDGQIVAFGVVDNDTRSRRVRIYRYNGSLWSQLGQDIDGEVVDGQGGYSVTLSADGQIVAFGVVDNDTHFGRVRIYQYNDSSWTQLGQSIDSNTTCDLNGYSVSLSSDGQTVAIGAHSNNTCSGRVRIYRYLETATDESATKTV